jgi:hypothetical protein
MPQTYLRNKHASTTVLDDGSLLLEVVLNDSYFSSSVEMVIAVPDLEIVSVKGEIDRCFNEKCSEAILLLQQAVGLRIGPGLIKSVTGLIGGSKGCPNMADLVLECCDQVVLHFTLQQMKKAQEHGSEQDLALAGREMIRQNPGLIGSCIAFSEGIPLLGVFEE